MILANYHIFGNKLSSMDAFYMDAMALWRLNPDFTDSLTIGPYNGVALNNSGGATTMTFADYNGEGIISPVFSANYLNMTPAGGQDFSFNAGTDDLPFSISAWILIDGNSVTENIIISKSTTNFTNWSLGTEFDLSNSSHRLVFKISSSRGLSAVYNPGLMIDGIEDGNWHHIVATYDGSKNAMGVNLYVDGLLVTSTKSTHALYVGLQNNLDPVIIGRSLQSNAGRRQFKGGIRDVAVWDSEISQSKVSAIYSAGLI